jgi:hypothetical protein
MKWYVSQNRKAEGPLSEQRVEMLVNWGRISRTAYICDEQASCWVPITRSQFAALLGPVALERSDATASVRRRRAPGSGARAWHTFQLWVALALLISFCTLALLVSVRRSAGFVPRSSVARSGLLKHVPLLSSSGRAKVQFRFAR